MAITANCAKNINNSKTILFSKKYFNDNEYYDNRHNDLKYTIYEIQESQKHCD